MKPVGITTTLPIEILLAAGYTPVDLNNLFVSHPDPGRLLEVAEKDGFPLNTCTWIKGLYGVCLESGIGKVIGVTGGDCSNTLMLMEALGLKGIETVPFDYPRQPDAARMQFCLQQLAGCLGTSVSAAEEWREKLQNTRKLALELDRLTWQEDLVSGFENHIWLVSSSDFNQDHRRYSHELSELVAETRQRRPYGPGYLRLAYIGVPPIFARHLYSFIEECGGRVVFNEIQRQFAMPEPGPDLARQYSSYTYPYATRYRLADIQLQTGMRKVDGIVHYAQSFCHRTMADITFRSKLDLPILTLEGGTDFCLNQHVKTRIEAFIDMLRRSKIIRQNKYGGMKT